MKRIIFWAVSLLVFSSVQMLPAQVYENSVNYGTRAIPEIVKPITGGKWMIVGVGFAEPYKKYSDTLFLLVRDCFDHLLLNIRLKAPYAEAHHIHDALPTPDGGFLISFESTDCDVGNQITSLQKLNAHGDIQWEQQSEMGSLPKLLDITPDGNIFGVTDYQFQKIDILTGQTIWVTMFDTDVYWVNSFLLEPGTENVYLNYGSMTYYFEQNSNVDTVYYEKWYGFEHDFSVRKMLSGNNGNIFLFDETHVDQIKLPDIINHLPLPAPGFWFDWTTALDGFYWLGRSSGKTVVLKTNWNLQPLKKDMIEDAWLFGYRLGVWGNRIMVAGMDGAGFGSSLSDDIFSAYKSSALWTRCFWENAVPGSDSVDASVTGIEQTVPVEVTMVGQPPYNYYKVKGGYFRILVHNSGNQPIHSLYINTVYEVVQSICFYTPAQSKYFDQLNLMPNEEIWLDFGPLEEKQQNQMLGERCFWTSSPNGLPDAVHTNDYSCISLIVPIQTPAASPGMRIYPNPANDGFYIETEETTDYQLFDLTGRIIAEGRCDSAPAPAWVSVADLPNGVYALRAGAQVQKVRVQH